MHLSDYLRSIRRRWILIVASILLFAAAAAALSAVQKPDYVATAKVFVSTSGTTVADLSQGNTFTQQVVKSYADVATTPYVLDPVIRKLSLPTTASALASEIEASAPADTVLVQVDAHAPNGVQSAELANEVSSSLINVVNTLVPQDSASSAVKLTQVQQATVPTKPATPNVLLNIAVGLVAGVLFGIALAIALDALDTRIRSDRDLRAITAAPVLGSISFDARARTQHIVADQEAHGQASEAYRSLRTNLQFLNIDEGARSIVITSSVESEGKSTSAANLAVTLAQAGERTLLIEGDLRRPRVAEYLGLDGSVGLTDLLIGKSTMSEVVQEWGDTGLSVLPAGAIPPNPSELLASTRMAEFLRDAERSYTRVIIDAPPLLPVTDAAILSKIAGGALLVCASSKTRRSHLASAVRSLDTVGARILGVVLTMVPTRGVDSYGYGYGYGYGYQSRDAPGSA